MKRKGLSVALTTIFLIGLLIRQSIPAQAAETPEIIPEITICAPWDSNVTFTFTNVYELCRESDGKVSGIFFTYDGTFVISKDVTGQFDGDVEITSFEGNIIHKAADTFEYSGSITFFEEDKDVYLQMGIARSPEKIFGEASGFSNLRDYSITTTETNPTASTQKIIATPTSSTVLVNDISVDFDAYNIEGYNYFKLRDLAFVLSGTPKQFEVGWDDTNKAVTLTSGKPYTVTGGEMSAKGQGVKSIKPTTSKIILDGKEVSFTAYNIDGYNYFKLQEIGEALNFSVDWDDIKRTVIIDTTT